MVGWLVNWFNSQLVGVRVTVRVDVPGHRGAADYPPDHAKMKVMLPPALSMTASAGVRSPLDTSVSSADFVLHIS